MGRRSSGPAPPHPTTARPPVRRTNLKTTVDIHTAASCLGTPGPGGYAAVADLNGPHVLVKGNQPRTTEARMELTAALTALKALDDIPHIRQARVIVHSQSHFLVNSFNAGKVLAWEKRNWPSRGRQAVRNRDIWKDLLTTSRQRSVAYVLVPLESRCPIGDLSARLAVEEAQDAANHQPPSPHQFLPNLEGNTASLFSCQPSQAGTLVTPPIPGPDGQPISVLVVKTDTGYLVTDQGLSVRSLNAARGANWTTSQQTALVQSVAHTLGVQLHEDNLVSNPALPTEIAEAVLRIAAAAVQTMSPITICRTQPQHGE